MAFFTRMFGGAGSSARISCADYKARFMEGKEAHTLVDVRTAPEFSSGYIPGAINVDLQQLNDKLSRIPKDKPVVVYCRSGARSASAASVLKQAGYTDVYDLGGIIGWVSSGYPVKSK